MYFPSAIHTRTRMAFKHLKSRWATSSQHSSFFKIIPATARKAHFDRDNMDFKVFLLFFALCVSVVLAAKPTIDPKLKWHRPIVVPPQWYKQNNKAEDNSRRT
ncbi:unnamed protein product [Ceratitis capitata]|uniref:(Mediterranean fruit fly) hypothetical protein n=1 Tax=Ceratitis capitata TaxID=7213 RepID=A0A811V4U5_CERCA|nr:unnamed protein product [Ceratitis capitata]